MFRNKLLLALALLVGFVVQANAATCFWVAGTSWNTAANWSVSSGGAGSTCLATGGVPGVTGGTADIAKLDASSPVATLTVDVDLNIGQIDTTALTGGSVFNDGGHTITTNSGSGMNCSGTGTRTLTFTGTWNFVQTVGTLWSCTTTTNLTLNASSMVINVNGNSSGAARIFDAGSTTLTYGTININSDAGNIRSGLQLRGAGTITITTLTMAAGQQLNPNVSSYVITNALALVGTPTLPITIDSAAETTQRNIALTASTGTGDWVIVRDIAFITHNLTITNYVNAGNNSGVTGTAPTGGASCIGC